MGIIVTILGFVIFWILYNFIASLEDYEWNSKTKRFKNWKDKWM